MIPRQTIAVLGASGQLGSDLTEVLERDTRFEVVSYSRQELDVTDAETLEREIAPGRFHAVINTAAITNVDWCEENGAQAMEVNASGAYLVARACAKAGSRNVFISTDFVFDGEKDGAYFESDEPKPVNIYGASKLVGERVAQIAAPDSLVVRISSVFGKAGSRGKGGNFIETILSRAKANQPLRVVDDTVMSPSYTRDVARAVAELLPRESSGTVHLSNRGSCSWFDFANYALELAEVDADIAAVDSSEFPRPAKRPRNSALASERLAGLIGREMPRWQDAIAEYLQEKGYLVGAVAGGNSTGGVSPEESTNPGGSVTSEEPS